MKNLINATCLRIFIVITLLMTISACNVPIEKQPAVQNQDQVDESVMGSTAQIQDKVEDSINPTVQNHDQSDKPTVVPTIQGQDHLDEPLASTTLNSSIQPPQQSALMPLTLKPQLSMGTSLILGDTWFPIGPAPIDDFFPGGVTGRASAIAVNPLNPNDVWLGTASGGVWHSNNGGVNWRPMSDQEDFLAIGAVALDNCSTQSCMTVYAGTGENAIRRDTYYGGGLLIGQVSGEFGEFAWSLRDGSPDYNFRFGSINNILLDPTTSGMTKRLYITLSSGVTAAATESTVTAPEPSPGGFGIYQSDDNGLTWSKLSVAGAVGDRPTDLEMDPNDSNILYAGFLEKGVFKGIRNSGDGTINWCPLNDGITRPSGCPRITGLPNPATTPFDHVEITIFPDNSSILYAMFGQCPDQLLQNCVPFIYKSMNGGIDWEQKLAGNSTDNSQSCPRVYSRYTHALTIHPTLADTLFLGGIHLCKSIDSGQSFVPFDMNDGGGIVHVDHHDVIIHPMDPNRMYDASDGGFAFSTGGGATWRPGNNDLQITGFQSIASSPLTDVVIGASQDNGVEMWIGSRIWDSLKGAGIKDGGFTIMDFDNIMVMYSALNFGTPKRSNDGGNNWTIIENGIPPSDQRLFYAPFIQDPSPPHPLYFGTNRLFKSIDDGDSWNPVSPVLSTSVQPEIVTAPSVGDHITAGGVDVITSIAVAPNDPNRIYIGYYGGELFVTSGACTDPACWTNVSSSLPAAPITWIAVDPDDPDTAYVTLSGFDSTAHVWKTTNGGINWSPVINGLPLRVPANTISIEPSAHENLWLGTDAGANWIPFNHGLPNAPVYMISIDETHGRVYAATHGRGAFVLTKPFLSNFEGWVDGQIWDIPVYGNGFPPNQPATMEIIQEDGTICAQSSFDAFGGEIRTDKTGQLVTSQGGIYSGKPVAWACFNGDCLGGVPIETCNEIDADGNPVNLISTIRVIAGGVVGLDGMQGCPLQANPPSSTLGLPNFSPPGDGGSLVQAVQSDLRVGSFDLVASVQVGDGSTRALCAANVPFQDGDTSQQVLTRAQDALNTNSACIANTVSAEVDFGESGDSEDEFPRDPRLWITAPDVSGSQLVTSIHAAPGSATDVCFDVGNLGVPVLNSITIMKLQFEALPTGATGGEITVIEWSGVGTCEISVTTTTGDTAEDIAAKAAAAFQSPGIPGPNPDCPSKYNARDVTLHGDSIIMVMASGISVCVRDSGVGFSIAPEELSIEIADLSIVKTGLPNPVTAGSNLTYTLSVTNNGPGDASGVTATDSLPTGVSFVSATASQGSCTEAGGVVTCALGDLANGASAIIAITVNPATCGTITNTAEVTGNEIDPNTTDNSASADTTVICPADLSITKIDSSDPVIAGTDLTYTLIVSNNGPGDATGVIANDTLPAGITLVSATASQGSCTEAGGVITCDLGDLANSASASIAIVVTVSSSTSCDTTLTNTAEVTSAEPDPDSSNNTASADTTVICRTDLSISKSDSPDPVYTGEILTYELSVSNDGPSDATGVTVVDNLPTEVNFISATPSQGSCGEAGGVVNCDLGSLADDESATITIVVTPTAGGTITNTANVAGNEIDPDSTNNTASASTTGILVVGVDIKPGNPNNPINPGSNGQFPVAILSSDGFDAPGEIEIESLTFGRTGDEVSLVSCQKNARDVNHDGFKDLVCHFYTQLTNLQAGDTESILKANTTGGILIEGRDLVRTVPR